MQEATTTENLATYFTISGALLGVVLTVTVQMIVSWWNRRNDRRLQTFEIRMAVYAKFCEYIVNLHESVRLVNELGSTIDDLEKEVDPALAKYVEVNHEVNNLEAMLNNLNLEEHPDEANKMKSELAQKKNAWDIAGRKLQETRERVYKMRNSLNNIKSEISNLKEYMNGESWKIHLIASKKVREAALAVYDRQRQQEDISMTAFEVFLALARKEIGIAK